MRSTRVSGWGGNGQAAAVVLAGLTALLGGARPVAAADDFELEPIRYSASTPDNAVVKLEQRLAAGKARLTYDDKLGYLRSLLRELAIPEPSQTLVFSKTSLQRNRIGPRTPRALYFSDDAYVGYCQGGEVLEISVADSRLGTVFYTLEQQREEKPRFVRQTDRCLLCHGSSQTRGVPGHLVRSVLTDAGGFPILSAGTYRIDQTSPLERRWGGWYVTGTHGKQTHLGNLIVRTRRVPEPIDNKDGLNVTDLGKRVDLSEYPSRHSDLVALMVLEHQTEMHNLLTRAAFQTRMALHMEAALNRDLKEPPGRRWESTTSRIKSACEPLVRYLLFSKEAELTGEIRGTSTFAEEFARRGPRDSQGRSLRDFDLRRRLFKYPCSYLIYSPSFDALPGAAKEYVLQRLWEVLTGVDTGRDFEHLSDADRQAILAILLATRPDLPDYWRRKG